MVDSTSRSLARILAVLVAAAVAAVVGWQLFVAAPSTLAELLGVVLTLGLVVLAVRVAARAVASRFPEYNVAEVAVEGPITRDGRSGLPSKPGGASADDVVELVEQADDDDHARALLLKLNTPGGQVVPSDDIRRAAMRFDGPTVAYAVDTCASGGYWIATGCDELWARDASVVGSIGVIGSRPNVAELADNLGVSYERFAAGRYKDAGIPLKEVSEDERAYLQSIVDAFYENFVERVAEGRGIDPELVRETEARVYLGEEAVDLGLVDSLGDRKAIEERLEELLDEPATVREFTPSRGLRARIGLGAERAAYALGAGVASHLSPSEGFEFRF